MGSTKQRNRVNIGEERSRDSSRMRINNTAPAGNSGLTALDSDETDALGHVNSGGLVKGLVQATIVTVALLTVFTVGPYLMPEAKKPVAADKQATQPVPNEAAIDPTKSATDVANSAPTSNQQKAADHMGLSDTKTADPSSNPLEKKSEIDSLLDVD